MALVFKMTQEGQTKRLFEPTASNENGARTRQATATNGLKVQYSRTDQRKYSFAVRTVEQWNHLPDTVRQATSKEAFKSRLKQHRK